MSDEAIPEDIVRAVELGMPGHAEATAENIRRLAGLLVLAERERCAAIAQKLYDDWDRAPSWEVSKLPPNAAAAASSIRSSHE